MIEGLIVQILKQIVDERGKVMRMLRADFPSFTKFGEIYFSVVNPGVIKGWKKHLKATQHFAVPVGKIKLVIYDDREASSTRGQVEILEAGEDNYRLIRIPAQVWYSWQGISECPAMIANCTDLLHDPEESLKKDINTAEIPYQWETEEI